jgi:hypothetical protein
MKPGFGITNAASARYAAEATAAMVKSLEKELPPLSAAVARQIRKVAVAVPASPNPPPATEGSTSPKLAVKRVDE